MIQPNSVPQIIEAFESTSVDITNQSSSDRLSSFFMRSVTVTDRFIYFQNRTNDVIPTADIQTIGSEKHETSTVEWLGLSESAFEFWNNDEDSAYDDL